MKDDQHLKKLRLHLEHKRLEWAAAKVKLEIEELNYKEAGKSDQTFKKKTKIAIPEKRNVIKGTITNPLNIEKIISISIGIAFILSLGIYLFSTL